jgi:tetratricopeptide (TPR) repeat protein
MGVSSPTPPGEDPHAGAAWAETPVDVLLEQAQGAAAGGDLPRARTLLEGVLRKRSLTSGEEADAWDLSLELAVLGGRHDDAEDAVDQLAARLPIGEVRQRIRMVWVRHKADVTWEHALLERAEAAAAARGRGGEARAPEPNAPLTGTRYQRPPGGRSTPARAGGVSGSGDSAPLPSVLRLLEAIGADGDDADDPGLPDPESAALFREGGPPLYEVDELRAPVDEEQVRALLADEPDDAEGLPLLEGTELAGRSPGEIHRIVAEHPGASGRDLLRRYAVEQARRTSPEELQHSYDMAVEFFGQEQYEEAAHLLLPVATVENPERIGALELLARSLFELDRLPQAEAYLKEAVPAGRQVTDPAYAPLFYWLGKISEEKNEPGAAIDYYTSAVKLAPDLVEAKRRLHVLLAL